MLGKAALQFMAASAANIGTGSFRDVSEFRDSRHCGTAVRAQCINFLLPGIVKFLIFKMSTTAVIGAGGPTGSCCVKRLLELGQPTVAIVRNPSQYADKFPVNDMNFQLKQGDVTDSEGLKAVLQSTKTKRIIFAASGRGYFSAKSVDEQVKAFISYSCPALYGFELTSRNI